MRQRLYVQIVGYTTGDPDRKPPTLIIATDGSTEEITLRSGAELSYGLDDRHCAGRIADQTHYPCSEPEAPYCVQHTDRWPCARCRGDCTKPIDNCDKPHVLYLAAFAPSLFKIGVTKPWRLEQRLYEQGADRAALLEQFSDGRTARQRETALTAHVPDRIDTSKKFDSLHQSVDQDRWHELLDRFDPDEQYTLSYGVDLTHPAVPETTANGTVRGVKGRLLVLEADQTTYAVDLRDLVGYEVTDGGTLSSRQSSLGSF